MGNNKAAGGIPAGAALEPWPEDEAPAGVTCDDFSLGGHGRLVWGEGVPGSRIMILLDNPGAREDKHGTPYVCGTRRTLRRALAEAGLAREPVYLTYLVKCRPLRAYDKPRARRAGLGFFREQLAAHKPAVLVLLGDVVVQTVTGRDDASVRELRRRQRRRDGEAGSPPARTGGTDLQGKIAENCIVGGVPAVVGYHPLAARRRPVLYPLLVEDLTVARRLLRGTI